MPDPVYDERIVAFIDILGFGNLVDRLEGEPELHSKLQEALKTAGNYRRRAGDPQYAQAHLEASVFSDSIVLSSKPEHIDYVVRSCAGLQSQLLEIGVISRGGISTGKTFHEDDVLYGSGMIKAYRLETDVAIYPRIVIDPELLPHMSDGIRAIYLSIDNDGVWFIDQFAEGLIPSGVEQLLEDGWDPNDVALRQLEELIATEVESTNIPNHKMKWQWLERQRSEAANYLAEHGKPRFYHIWEALNTASHDNP